jgi:hypothetical protein
MRSCGRRSEKYDGVSAYVLGVSAYVLMVMGLLQLVGHSYATAALKARIRSRHRRPAGRLLMKLAASESRNDHVDCARGRP